jgi:hypothetical protein
MDCQQCRERLQEYLDGTLDADEQALVTVHVASCEACRRELDELRKVATLVGSLDEVPEPAGFLQAVRERIDRPTVWERLTGILTRPLRPGVSVAIPLIIVVFVAVFIIMTNLPKTTEHVEKAEEDESSEQIEIARTLEPSDEAPGKPERRFKYAEERELDEARPTEPSGDERAVGRIALNEKSRAAGDAEPEEADSERMTGDLSRGSEVTQPDTVQTATTDEEQVDRASVESLGDMTKGAGESALVEAGPSETQEETLELGVHVDTVGLAIEPEGATVIRLVVSDLETDLANVQRIVNERDGYAKEVREDGALKLLNLYVPADAYDGAVEQISLYNKQNQQALERKQPSRAQEIEVDVTDTSAKSTTRQKPLTTLPLVIRRITEQTPTAESE